MFTAVESLLDNIINDYWQIVDILMGTNCAPLVADLFLNVTNPVYGQHS